MVNNYYHFLNENTLNVYVPANPVTSAEKGQRTSQRSISYRQTELGHQDSTEGANPQARATQANGDHF
jgi:hypothetical protein